MSPLCQNQILPEQLNVMERFYPLKAFVCHSCFLVQLHEYVDPDEIFSEYAYFSSYSDSWVQHAKEYVDMVSNRLRLGRQSKVVELASNDGYLLQHFADRKIPCLGIEPAENVAKVARDRGIDTISKFFGSEVALEIALEFGHADLVIGNNVLAHVPALNNFVSGIEILLSETGVVTMEFPHLEQLIDENQFDTIYHEHFSYFSFHVVEKIFAHHNLRIFDVDELKTHGGSLRIYACHRECKKFESSKNVEMLRSRELDRKFNTLEFYESFSERVKATKREILTFLIQQKEKGKSIVGYGAPGKGNTLLNYCGIGTDFIDYTVDRNPYKINTYTPGTHIPIYDPSMIAETKPDFVFILPWNLKNEIAEQNNYIKEWGGQFVVPIPGIQVF